MPALPPDVERTNPTLAAEFETVTKNLRTLTSQIALLDRIHSIKVQPSQLQREGLSCLLDDPCVRAACDACFRPTGLPVPIGCGSCGSRRREPVRLYVCAMMGRLSTPSLPAATRLLGAAADGTDKA